MDTSFAIDSKTIFLSLQNSNLPVIIISFNIAIMFAVPDRMGDIAQSHNVVFGVSHMHLNVTLPQENAETVDNFH